MNVVELVASWLTPTVLFCVLNLMIGTIFLISGLKFGSNPPKARESDAVSPPQLTRVPSFFERVNSIKFSFSRDPVPVSTTSHDDVSNQDQARQRPEGNELHVRRSKSDAGANSSEPAAVMKKSASEKAPVPAAENEGEVGGKLFGFGGGDVDARADDFINKFRQQLKLQRLDSLLRYREMLKRG